MKIILTLGLSTLISLISFGQEGCMGSLGANQFEDGDFGLGNANNISSDPNIAPGYNYVTSGLLLDGDYILTNNMGNWSELYQTWLPLRDNSPNIQGYMMVVNASFEPGLFYEEIIEGICENTQFEFSADIINVIRRNVVDHIRPNVAFLIDDEVVLQTGDIPQDERWHTYAFNFTTEPGQNSVKLSLRNNAPGGIGNDLALDNIKFRACGPPSFIVSNITDSIGCLEDLPLRLEARIEATESLADPFYQWEEAIEEEWVVIPQANQSSYTIADSQSGAYSYRLSFAGSEANLANEKCRFFSEPFVINIPQRTFDRTDTICGGTGIDISGLTITEPGVYVEPLISSLGCDSITTFFIDTISRATISAQLDITSPICFGQATGTINGSQVQNGYDPYFISVDGEDYPSLTADSIAAGTKSVQIKDRYGCFFESQVILSEPEQFRLYLGDDQEIILGEELIIDLNSNQEIVDTRIIENIDGLSDTSGLQFLPYFDSRLILEATSIDGCLAIDTLLIIVDQDVRMYIPNAFSPNSDGKNDEFKISVLGKSIAQIDEFKIFSRWGETIDNINEISWNGKAPNGEELSAGVYLYYLKTTLINGAVIEKKGTIQLIK